MSMRNLALAVILGAGALSMALVQRQQPQPPPSQLIIQQVKSGLYAVLNPGANTVAVRVTKEGVIIVDDMFERDYDQIVARIKTVTSQRVKYVISTHHHPDHTGGNVRFFAANAEIIGHKNARAHMVNAPNPMPGPPRVTVTTESAVHLGGAEVQIHHVGRGHTDGDAIVYFPDLRVMATGDLFVVLPRMPVIDYTGGGTTLEWPKTLDNVLKFDFDAAIPGHGPVSTKADVEQFKERLGVLQTRTRDLIRQGVAKEQLTMRLKVDDLGWSLDPTSLFVRNSLSGFYDEMATPR